MVHCAGHKDGQSRSFNKGLLSHLWGVLSKCIPVPKVMSSLGRLSWSDWLIKLVLRVLNAQWLTEPFSCRVAPGSQQMLLFGPTMQFDFSIFLILLLSSFFHRSTQVHSPTNVLRSKFYLGPCFSKNPYQQITYEVLIDLFLKCLAK